VDLAAVVGLVLEEVRQDIVAAILLDTLAAVDPDDLGQGLRGQALDMGKQRGVAVGLPRGEGRQIRTGPPRCGRPPASGCGRRGRGCGCHA
jgi:hypothetical protein